jgi:ferric-dicitrate binding protein FerR (iron transport regulator)
MQYSDQLLQAIENYLNGKATAAEKQLVNDWYRSFDDENIEVLSNEKGYNRFLEVRLKNRIQQTTGLAETATTVKRLIPWPRIAVAAAAVAAITLGVWLYNISNTPRHPDAGQDPGLAMNDIAPGKNTATLTLADGKVINLDTNKTSVIVADSVKAMTMLTASTPRGGTYQFTLPDGSKVWLNAESKISFPSQFSGETRKIILSGEAYFEVAKNKHMPFIVESAGQHVEVLGTHFNINSYADEGSTRTTLLEGSVRVSSLLTSSSLRGRTEASRSNLPGRGPSTTPGKATILKPNQQAILDNYQINVTEVDPSEAVAWKEGNFVFNDEDLESILRKVARWYDVDIVYESKPAGVSLLGEVSRSKNVSAVLHALEQTGKVHFRIEGRRIVVMK